MGKSLGQSALREHDKLDFVLTSRERLVRELLLIAVIMYVITGAKLFRGCFTH